MIESETRSHCGVCRVRVNSPVAGYSAAPILTMNLTLLAPKYGAVSGFQVTSTATKLAPFSSVPELSGSELTTFPSWINCASPETLAVLS